MDVKVNDKLIDLSGVPFLEARFEVGLITDELTS
jgi:hypothetical protein